MIFENDDPEVGRKFLKLVFALDGTQPCKADPDKYTENWTSRPIPPEVARRACAGCKFVTECLDYATAAQEKGIWGGTTTEERRVKDED